MSNINDLTKEAPRSPRVRLGGYALLARALDKGRASLNGAVGEYHFACPLDQMLFGFKGVSGDDVKALLESGSSDEQVVAWFDANGEAKTAEEIKTWSDGVEAYNPTSNPEKKEWFAEQCAEAGIDPETNTLFDWLETDDKLSYAAAA